MPQMQQKSSKLDLETQLSFQMDFLDSVKPPTNEDPSAPISEESSNNGTDHDWEENYKLPQ